jgi:hypothetical protein
VIDDPRLIFGIFGLVFLLFLGLSIRCGRVKERQFLKKSLGRTIRPGEEDTLGIWLKVPTAQLGDEVRELEKNPFAALANSFSGLPGTPPYLLPKSDLRNYEPGLADIRRRRLVRLVLLLSFLPAMLLARGAIRPTLQAQIALAWVLASIWIDNWVRLTRCPGCGELFHVSGKSRSTGWTRTCVNCGLSLHGVQRTSRGDPKDA